MRGVIDHDGQRVSALDRLYLADQMPTLIVWGDDDPVIPVEHGRNAHRIVEHSRYVELARLRPLADARRPRPHRPTS